MNNGKLIAAATALSATCELAVARLQWAESPTAALRSMLSHITSGFQQAMLVMQDELSLLESQDAMKTEALRFYAEGQHFIRADADKWETPSGETGNFFEDEANTAIVEDGTVARRMLMRVVSQVHDETIVTPVPMNRWQAAIDREMTTAMLGVANDHDDPHALLQQIIQWNVMVALDPAVSDGAAALVDSGLALAETSGGKDILRLNALEADKGLEVSYDTDDEDLGPVWRIHRTADGGYTPVTEAATLREALDNLIESKA